MFITDTANIYVIISSDKYLKVGYSSNIKSRMLQYKTHNPDFKLFATFNIPDAKNWEKEFHKEHIIDSVNTEWYLIYDVLKFLYVLCDACELKESDSQRYRQAVESLRGQN